MNNHYSNNYKKINQSKNSTKPHNLTKDFKNKPKPIQNPSTSNESTPRINKAIATSGFCSRRKADELIFAGKVMVNGKIEQNPGTRLKKGDVISIDGQTLAWDQTPKFYLLLNKPIHTVCTAHDPEGRTTVLDLLPDNYHNIRLFPVGRLDYFSEGLLILTNDGDLTNMLIHPRFHLAKIYEVTIRGVVSQDCLKTMRNGMTLADGEKLLPMQVQDTPLPHDQTLLTITLHQGINRQIRRVCSDLNLTILRLVRVAEGPLKLGDLPSGQFRELKKEEILSLQKATNQAKPFPAKPYKPKKSY